MAFSKPSRANNSVGLGGTDPPGRINRFLFISEGCTKSIRFFVGLVRNWVIPCSFWEILKTLFKPGLRMSRPTITTFLPNKERLIAKLDDTKDLPSPLTVDVTRITFLPFSSINWRLVRTLRNVSLIKLLWFSNTAIEPDFSSANGISPITGREVSFSTSARPSILNLVKPIR